MFLLVTTNLLAELVRHWVDDMKSRGSNLMLTYLLSTLNTYTCVCVVVGGEGIALIGSHIYMQNSVFPIAQIILICEPSVMYWEALNTSGSKLEFRWEFPVANCWSSRRKMTLFLPSLIIG